MFLLNTTRKHPQCGMEKVCEPLDLITGWPSFGSNNLNQTFPVADETCTMVRRNFRPFLCKKLLQFSNILGMSGKNRSLEVMTQNLNWVEVRTQDWATREGVFSSVEAIPFMIYFYALSRCSVASLILYWASVGGQMVLSFPAKCLDKFGIWLSITAMPPCLLNLISQLGWGFDVGALCLFFLHT